MRKELLLRIFLLLVLFILLFPALKLIMIYVEAYDDQYTLEIDSYENVITRYRFDKDAELNDMMNGAANGRQLGSVKMNSPELDSYYESIMKEYAIDETDSDVSDVYSETLKLSDKREMNELNALSGGDANVLLGNKDSEIIGNLKNLKILHNFDDSGGVDEFNEKLPETEEDMIARSMDRKEIESYVNDQFVRKYSRDVSSLKVFQENKFYTSPIPDNRKRNSDGELSGLELIVGKDKYYCFEIVKMNLVSKVRVNLRDLKIYVVRDNYIFPNIGGENDSFFKYKNNTIYSTVALGYNPPPGKYFIVVKSRSNPGWEGLKQEFDLVRRRVPRLKKGFSVVNLEHTIPLKTMTIQGPGGHKGDYREMAKWVKLMGADAFWMLVAQTTGWNPKISPSNPWVKSGFDNLKLLAPHFKSNDIEVGAYIMSYFTPANGKKKAGYNPSLGYAQNERKIQDSLHVSLNCKKRFNDILAVAKSFDRNPYVDYIGLDFIRTGRADGYEMGPQVIEEMNIKVPPSYHQLSYIDKVKWFADRIENDRNQKIIRKWRWWRAHRVAEIANQIITEGEITKPMWCFTLGWEHGKQHGQDPYMFYDAGMFIDAVMLYEANSPQFKNMMVQWRNYMRDNNNNMVIGNACDTRFLDGDSNNPAIEYLHRTRQGVNNVYRNGQARGIFFHDLSRALWSSKRGITTSEWAIINGHATSAYRHSLGMIPYQGWVKFNADNTTGKIIIQNQGDTKLSSIRINFVNTEAWEKIDDNVPEVMDLEPGETKEFIFKAEVRQKFRHKEPILGYYLTHRDYPRYFFFSHRSKRDYSEYLIVNNAP